MDTTMTTRCAWCGHELTEDDGGACYECNRDTCVDCGARLAHELANGDGVIDGGAAVFHLGTGCRWADYWGWTQV